MPKIKMAPVEIDNAYIVSLRNDGWVTEDIAKVFHKQKVLSNPDFKYVEARRLVEDVLLIEKRRKNYFFGGKIMNIDIEKIVTDKVRQMEESGVVTKTLEDKIEKAILSAVSEALDGYDLKRELSGMVSQQVMRIAKEIGFTAYNGFIVEKFKEIAESYVRQDVAEKIQKTFDSLLLQKRDSIKLSEIFEAYRKWACETVDTSDKYDYEHFYVKFQKHDVYDWYDVQLAEQTPENKYDSSSDIIRFTLRVKTNDGTGWISSSYINGENVKQKFKFGYLSDFEILILNLTFNETPIIIDIEHEDDIDTSYDVDI